MAKSKAKLGDRVLYRVAEEHQSKTVKNLPDAKGDVKPVETAGSVHHHEMEQFAGIVGRVHNDGGADLFLIVPGKGHHVWIEGAVEGTKPGQFEILS